MCTIYIIYIYMYSESVGSKNPQKTSSISTMGVPSKTRNISLQEAEDLMEAGGIADVRSIRLNSINVNEMHRLVFFHPETYKTLSWECGFKYVFNFTPKIGEDEPILTTTFQRGWFNHQLAMHGFFPV